MKNIVKNVLFNIYVARSMKSYFIIVLYQHWSLETYQYFVSTGDLARGIVTVLDQVERFIYWDRSMWGADQASHITAIKHCSFLLLSPYAIDVHQTLGCEIMGLCTVCPKLWGFFHSLTFLFLLYAWSSTKLSGCWNEFTPLYER